MDEILKYSILALILLLSNVVEAATGFGATVIALTLAVHLFPIDLLVAIIVPLNLLVSAYIVARYHEGIDRKILLTRILPLAGLGMPLGLVIFNLADTEKLKLAFGLFVLFFSIFELRKLLRSRDNSPRPLSGIESALWLISGGIIHGIYASGGPMVVYFASRNLKNKHNFRSTLSGLWVVFSAVLLISHVSTGYINQSTARISVFLLPIIVLGIILGEWIHAKLPERGFKITVFTILVFSGASIVIKSII